MKTGWKIFMVLAIMVGSTFLTSLSSTWQGIDLGSGWLGGCFSTKTGFPFNSISNPPAGCLCIPTSNALASSLNYLFWLIILTLIVYIAYKVTKTHRGKKI